MRVAKAWALRALVGWAVLGATPGVALANPVAAVAPVSAAYVLRYGDTLNLMVLENDKLKAERLPLRPDGRITFPLVGEVVAGGLSVAQLQARLTQLYARYYTDPHVVVNVADFRKQRISVVGHLNQSRTLEVPDAIRLMDAIAQAGGYNRRADLDRVVVIRASGKVEEINVNRILQGEVAGNVLLQDGDTVQIQEQFGPDWVGMMPQMVTVFAVLANVFIVFITRLR